MQKYLASSIKNKKVDGDCGRAEVFNNLFKKSKFQNIKYVNGQNFLSTPSMKSFNEQIQWNTLYIFTIKDWTYPENSNK